MAATRKLAFTGASLSNRVKLASAALPVDDAEVDEHA
jgi:hypothetical protein